MPEYRFFRVAEHGYLFPNLETADCSGDDGEFLPTGRLYTVPDSAS
jgi:hypothetical protein